MGAGVPRPVHPKSHTHRKATAKPSTEGTAAIQRHRATPAVSTRKPSQDGNNQNHSAKNPAPTIRDAIAVGHRTPPSLALSVLVSSRAMGSLLSASFFSLRLGQFVERRSA